MKLMNNFLVILLATMLAGCYTFKATSIDAEIETFSMENFQVSAANAQPGLGVTISDKLSNRILRETKLSSVTNKGDVSFSGEVTNYDVAPVTSQADATVSQNRLTIAVKVTYTNTVNEKNSWEETVKRFEDFSGNVNFNSVEDQLIEDISTQIVDEIFRKSFENW